MLAHSKMTLEMAKVLMNGTTGSFMKETGKMVKKMDMGFGNLPMEIVMSVIGSTDVSKEKALILTKQAFTRESF